MRTLLGITGIILFVASFAANFFIRKKFKPQQTDFEDMYWEFEEKHPDFLKYKKLLNFSFEAMAIAALLIFLAVFI